MKKNKLMLTLGVSVSILGMLVSCGGRTVNKDLIYLVTDIGNIDDKSFNQSAWEGVTKFSSDNGKTGKYLRPTEDSTNARLETIESAYNEGAAITVMPGFLFEEAAFIAQQQFKDMSFIFIDGSPTKDNETVLGENLTSIFYNEIQSGWLAGYFAAKEYNKGKDTTAKLGFFGGIGVGAVQRFGYGFCAGVEYFTQQETNSSKFEVFYQYSGSFAPDATFVTLTEGWYDNGVDCIFSCGGGIYISVLQAAKNKNKKLIGVDSDQGLVLGEDAPYMLTSAMKGVKSSTINALTAFYKNDGKLPAEYAGQTVTYSAKDDGVSLGSKETWNFEKSEYSEYETLYTTLKSADKAGDTSKLYSVNTEKNPDEQGFKNVLVKYIQ